MSPNKVKIKYMLQPQRNGRGIYSWHLPFILSEYNKFIVILKLGWIYIYVFTIFHTQWRSSG